MKEILKNFNNPFICETSNRYAKFVGYALYGVVVLVSLPILPLAAVGVITSKLINTFGESDGSEDDE